jgi:hypothetical protein
MAQAEQTKFVRRVREEMREQSLSVRGLARRMDPQNVDRARRNLHRWLDEGISPNRASVSDIATALGIDEGDLDEEDELPLALDTMLRSYLRKLIREEVRA